jgi:hypothetical protein
MTSIPDSSKVIFHIVSYDMGPPALLLLQRKACCGFLLPLKIYHLGLVEYANLGSSCKHATHYTTEATCLPVNCCLTMCFQLTLCIIQQLNTLRKMHIVLTGGHSLVSST